MCPIAAGGYGTGGYVPTAGYGTGGYGGGGYGPGGYSTGIVTTAVIPAAPIVYPGRPFGGGNALGAGRFGSLPPKIRVIFMPQGGGQVAPQMSPCCSMGGMGGMGGGMYSFQLHNSSKIDSFFSYRSWQLRWR